MKIKEICVKCGRTIRSTKIKRGKRLLLYAGYPELKGQNLCDDCIGHHIVNKTFGGKVPTSEDAMRILREAKKR